MKIFVKPAAAVFCLLILAVSSGFGLSASIYTPPFDPQAEGIYIVNEDTGLPVYAKNENSRFFPASMTKIMSALIVLENVPDLDQKTTMHSGIASMISGTGSVVLGLINGEEISVRDLLYSFLMKSAGDAVLLAAEYTGGTVEDFVAMMNARAAQIGCADTHFANPHGLHDGNHYTTPSDLYKIAAEAMKNPLFREVCAMSRYTVPATNKSGERLVINSNIMLSANTGGSLYYEPIRGIKTGFTTPAGPCLASVAVKNNETYYIIVMKSTALSADGTVNKNGAFALTKQLYEWLFSSYKLQTLITASTALTTAEVKYGKGVDSVGLVPSEDFVTLLPRNADQSSVVVHYSVSSPAVAPLEAGTVMGVAYIEISGQRAGEVTLVAANAVERDSFLYFMAQAGSFLTSGTFFIVGGVVLFFIAGYVLLNFLYNRGRRRHAGQFGRAASGKAVKRKKHRKRPANFK